MTRADVDAMLQPGETLLWSAAHDGRKTMRQMLLVVSLLFLICLLLGAVSVSMALERHAPLWIGPSAVMGFFLPVAALCLWSARMARRKSYAITNQSVVIIRRDPLLAVDRYQPKLDELRLVLNDDGTGDILFARGELAGRSWDIGFMNVADAAVVYALLRKSRS